MNSVPVNYPLWSWSKSNGSATDAQTVAAYESTTTRGYTADFSRHVWNDLVITLNKLLTVAGIGWDGKYTDFDDAKVHEPNGLLTAKMFNSVRHNIEKAAFTTWKWEFDRAQVGYVGRNDFFGVADVGEKRADIVYGWYIIELARKLNVLIELLRGTANVAEMSLVDNAESLCVVDFDVLQIIKLNPENKHSRSCLETYMCACEIVALKLKQEISSFLVADASNAPSVPLFMAYLSQIFNETNVNLADAVKMSANENSETDTEARVLSLRLVPMPGVNLSESEQTSSLTGCDTIRLSYTDISISKHCADILVAKWYYSILSSVMSDTFAETELRVVEMLSIYFSLMSESVEEVSVNISDVVTLLSSIYANSFVNAFLIDAPPNPIRIIGMSNSATSVDTAVDGTSPIIATNTSSGISVVQSDTIPSNVFKITLTELSINASKLDMLEVSSVEIIDSSESNTVVRMPIWYCPAKRESDLYVRSVYNEPVRTKNNLHIS